MDNCIMHNIVIVCKPYILCIQAIDKHKQTIFKNTVVPC